MAKKKDKSLPRYAYPAAPYLIGLNCIELAVSDPAAAADRFVSIGFQDRSEANGVLRVSISGLTLHLTPRAKDAPKAQGQVFEVTVDQVEMLHLRLQDLGLTPNGLFNRPQGDRAFEWIDPDGHCFRFIGPARRADDPQLEDDDED